MESRPRSGLLEILGHGTMSAHRTVACTLRDGRVRHREVHPKEVHRAQQQVADQQAQGNVLDESPRQRFLNDLPSASRSTVLDLARTFLKLVSSILCEIAIFEQQHR